MQPYTGECAALAAAFLNTFCVLSFEAAGKRIGSLSVNILRLLLSLLFLMAYTQLRRGLALPLDAPVSAWVWLGLSGIIGFFLGDLFLFRSFLLIGTRRAMLIMNLTPPMTAALGWSLLSEGLAVRDLCGMALTLFGVAWVILERSPQANQPRPARPFRIGVVFATLGAVGQAVGLVLSKRGMQLGDGAQYDPFAATEIRMLLALVAFALLNAYLGRGRHLFAALREGRAMAQLSFGAFAGPFLGVSLSLLAIQHTTTGVAATIMAIIPVLILPFSIWLHRERVTLRAAAGAGLAVAGVALLFL